jgi:putative endonuclease
MAAWRVPSLASLRYRSRFSHDTLNISCLNAEHYDSMEKSAYVYILASALNGTLYIGVTSNLVRRVWEHREGLADGFTKKYSVKRLVWYEVHSEIREAITREKQLKQWNRAWKLRLIHKANPCWRDLFEEIAV